MLAVGNVSVSFPSPLNLDSGSTMVLFHLDASRICACYYVLSEFPDRYVWSDNYSFQDIQLERAASPWTMTIKWAKTLIHVGQVAC